MEIVKTEIVYLHTMDGVPEYKAMEVRRDLDDEGEYTHETVVVVRAYAVAFTVRTVNEFTGDEIIQFVKDKLASEEK